VTSLAALLEGIERGEFPPADMGATLVAQPSPRDAAVLSTTGHVIIAAEVTPGWLATTLPPAAPGEAFNPPFLGALTTLLGRRVNNIDALAISPPRSGPPALDLTEVQDQTHPRVRRARRYRDDVRVWSCPGGVLAIGRGLAGRWEVGLEVDPAYRGRGWVVPWLPPRRTWWTAGDRCGRRSPRATRPACARSSPPVTCRSARRRCSSRTRARMRPSALHDPRAQRRRSHSPDGISTTMVRRVGTVPGLR
jgi:hypothetical protein